MKTIADFFIALRLYVGLHLPERGSWHNWLHGLSWRLCWLMVHGQDDIPFAEELRI